MPEKISLVTIAALLACPVLAGSMMAHADVTGLSCVQTAPAEYKLSYSLTGDSHTVEIFASPDPAGAKGRQSVLKTSDTSVTVHAGEAGQRVYFFLKPDHGQQREVSIRHLPLKGTPNFRDLGGYETTDGRFVRWGAIYRSGVLSNLTAEDFTYLDQLDIHVICDFRTAQENATAPEIWIPRSNVEHVSLPIGSGGNKDVTTSMDAFLATNPSPAQLKDWLTKIYGGFAFTNAPEYSKVFAQLEQEHLPLLYHCTAGKDRTGVFSALLLLTLGVPEKTVLADYELTNTYLRDRMSSDASRKMLASNPALAHLTPEQRQVLMAADPEYLKSTLRHIEEKFGSFDNYRRSKLGVSDGDVENLRSRLLMK
jgi:protein-tyrosine phosphatase